MFKVFSFIVLCVLVQVHLREAAIANNPSPSGNIDRGFDPEASELLRMSAFGVSFNFHSVLSQISRILLEIDLYWMNISYFCRMHTNTLSLYFNELILFPG